LRLGQSALPLFIARSTHPAGIFVSLLSSLLAKRRGGKAALENFIVALCWLVCILSELPESMLRKIASK